MQRFEQVEEVLEECMSTHTDASTGEIERIVRGFQVSPGPLEQSEAASQRAAVTRAELILVCCCAITARRGREWPAQSRNVRNGVALLPRVGSLIYCCHGQVGYALRATV